MFISWLEQSTREKKKLVMPERNYKLRRWKEQEHTERQQAKQASKFCHGKMKVLFWWFLSSQWNRKWSHSLRRGSEVIHCEGEVDGGGLWREENGPCKYSRTAGNLGLLEALAISAMRCQLGLCPFLPPIMLSYARAGVELVSWKDGMRQSYSTWEWGFRSGVATCDDKVWAGEWSLERWLRENEAKT